MAKVEIWLVGKVDAKDKDGVIYPAYASCLFEADVNWLSEDAGHEIVGLVPIKIEEIHFRSPDGHWMRQVMERNLKEPA